MPRSSIPDFTLSANLTVDRLVTIGLNLGPFLKVDPADLRLRITDAGLLRLNLPDGETVDVTALAGSTNVRMTKLDVRSDGTLDADLSGRINVFGRRLANVDMDVDLTGDHYEVDIDDASVSLGYGSVTVSGYFRSNGRFSFTGSLEAEVGPCDALCMRGDVEVTVDNSGIEGSYDGRVCIALCAETGGSMNSRGKVSGHVRLLGVRTAFAFDLGTGGSDTRAPTFDGALSRRIVTEDVRGGTYRATYPVPTAHDNRTVSGEIESVPVPVVCTPVSGSAFDVGTTAVSCTARDAAGNTRTDSFNLVLVDTTP